MFAQQAKHNSQIGMMCKIIIFKNQSRNAEYLVHFHYILCHLQYYTFLLKKVLNLPLRNFDSWRNNKISENIHEDIHVFVGL